MKLIPLCLVGALFVGPAFGQIPTTPDPKTPAAPDMKLYPMPEGTRIARPSYVPCEQIEQGLKQPVLRYCALAPNAPWPPAPKPKPRSGIFPLDQT
ncbi:MAG: hypothetical protein EON93_12825 [Burkholderiales bacterium]|nr:MAG: hypothetical protein EON93_12825 [Burkholderiales bacterium]